jgi:hypothetical protein
MQAAMYLLKVNTKGKLFINGKMLRCPLEKLIIESDVQMVETSMRSQRITDYSITPYNKEAKEKAKKKSTKVLS